MRTRQRIIELTTVMHDLMQSVLKKEVPIGYAIEEIKKIKTEREIPFWQKELRYGDSGKWILDVMTPELLHLPGGETIKKKYWRKHTVPGISKSPSHQHGADLYMYLWNSDFLQFTPRVEDLDFYEIHSKERKQFWDREEFWVFAFRDAVISNRPPHNILVPGMLALKNGKIFRRFVLLHQIFKLKYKVLIQS